MEKQLDDIASLTLIGCGSMGSALLCGWLKSGLDPNTCIIVNPSPVKDFPVEDFQEIENVASVKSLKGPVSGVVILAVKPDKIELVLNDLKEIGIADDCLLVSVAAGISIKQLQKYSGHERVVRIMPNTGAAVGKSVSCAVAYSIITDAEKSVIDSLMSAVGQGVWVDLDEQMDAVTAISGCGPAYVFYFTKMLERAAKQIGLPDDVSELLARQTVVGAGLQLDELADVPLTDLIGRVASPGGSTEAGLRVLTRDFILSDLLEQTAVAARDRAESRRE